MVSTTEGLNAVIHSSENVNSEPSTSTGLSITNIDVKSLSSTGGTSKNTKSRSDNKKSSNVHKVMAVDVPTVPMASNDGKRSDIAKSSNTKAFNNAFKTSIDTERLNTKGQSHNDAKVCVTAKQLNSALRTRDTEIRRDDSTAHNIDRLVDSNKADNLSLNAAEDKNVKNTLADSVHSKSSCIKPPSIEISTINCSEPEEEKIATESDAAANLPRFVSRSQGAVGGASDRNLKVGGAGGGIRGKGLTRKESKKMSRALTRKMSRRQRRELMMEAEFDEFDDDVIGDGSLTPGGWGDASPTVRRRRKRQESDELGKDCDDDVASRTLEQVGSHDQEKKPKQRGLWQPVQYD